jgi:hypothetical protein
MGFFQSGGILNRRGFFGGAAKAFSPTDISGLQLWLDATTGLFDATSGGSAVTTDGSAVARWEDQSGNGYHFDQSTSSNRPVLKTSIQNSKNVLRFDGSNDILGGPSNLKFTYPVSIFCVVSKRGGSDYQGIYGTGILQPATGYGLFISSTTDNSGAFSTQVRSDANNSNLASTNYYTAALPTTNAFFIGAGIIDSSSNKAYFNNGSEDSLSHSIVSGTPNRGVGVGARYGGIDNTSPGFYFNGDIAEIIVYNSALASSDRGSVRDYLNSKWSIY